MRHTYYEFATEEERDEAILERILWLRTLNYDGGLSEAEIGKVLGVSQQAVGRLLHNGLRKCQARLGRRVQEELRA